jgi:hypothetical protein
MPNFATVYQDTFKQLGMELRTEDGIPESEIAVAEGKIGVRLPAALRDYYLVAGNERRLNRIHNRLYEPEKWVVHLDNLVFMEENQAVVFWGVPLKQFAFEDPEVNQAPKYKGQPHAWFLEHKSCSTFLRVTLHWQGAFGGGMPVTKSAPASPDCSRRLEEGWSFLGEVNGMRAYNRPGQAVCYLQWQGFFDKTPSWRVFAGANNQEGLDAVAGDLQLKWD